jgi:hypothetical protein
MMFLANLFCSVFSISKSYTTKNAQQRVQVDLAYAFSLRLSFKFSIFRWRSRFWVRQTTNANRSALTFQAHKIHKRFEINEKV